MDDIQNMKISIGPKQNKPVKCVVYGPEGIGKSTFAAAFPDPLFIDTEGSTDLMDVKRFDRAPNWPTLLLQVHAVRQNPNVCRTLVLDTADWAERLCEDLVCRRGNQESIEGFGYGKGYTMVKEEFAKMLDLLTDVNGLGINIVITAHAIIRKFEKPEEMGAFDRYELKAGNKAGNQIAAILKEWADMVLFANYMETVVDVDGKKKVQGGRRVMYTQHAPTWDAKNRYGLAMMLPFDFEQIAKCIPTVEPATHAAENQAPAPAENPPVSAQPSKPAAPKQVPTPAPKTEPTKPQEAKPATTAATKPADQPREGVNPKLLTMADGAGITLQELSDFARMAGCLSGNVLVKDFPEGFFEQVLEPQWTQVTQFILTKVREPNPMDDINIPF
jgi:hypothetical protein